MSGLKRWAPLSGPAFVVLMVAGFAFAGSSPDTDDSNAKISSYIHSNSNQSKSSVLDVLLFDAPLATLAS